MQKKLKCTCGNEYPIDEMGLCKICEEPVCNECQAKYTNFSKIDYDCHQECADSSRE